VSVLRASVPVIEMRWQAINVRYYLLDICCFSIITNNLKIFRGKVREKQKFMSRNDNVLGHAWYARNDRWIPQWVWRVMTPDAIWGMVPIGSSYSG